jgi:hypothetical protein
MKRLVLLLALSLLALPALAAEDFTGKWSGTFSGVTSDGTQVTENIVLHLVQKGTELTGTAGPSDERQWKIVKGKVDGNKIMFEVTPENSGGLETIKLSLAYAEGRLKGDFNAAKEGVTLSAKVDVARAKQDSLHFRRESE